MTIAELIDNLEMMGIMVIIHKEDYEDTNMDISNIHDIDIWTREFIG